MLGCKSFVFKMMDLSCWR